MDADPKYHQCYRWAVLQEHECKPNPVTGRLVEWEHALYHAGRKVNEIWAIIPICWWAHLPGLNKEINRWLALNQMTEADHDYADKKYPRNTWREDKKRLNAKYGVPDLSTESDPF